jgi:hypothetical protein
MALIDNLDKILGPTPEDRVIMEDPKYLLMADAPILPSCLDHAIRDSVLSLGTVLGQLGDVVEVNEDPQFYRAQFDLEHLDRAS